MVTLCRHLFHKAQLRCCGRCRGPPLAPGLDYPLEPGRDC